MEPKTATVLSAEIPGFAELSAKYSSKEFNTLLKAFFEMADVTFRLHKGILSNFSGDSFLAVFEKQDKGDFSELFALEGANEFHDRLESFISDKNLPVAIQFKAGISSGEAIIAEISSEDKRQITVMGEAVNNANRLRDFADDNQILVCGKIFSKTNNQYTFQKLEPLPVRGSKENLEVYELREKKRTKIQPGSIPERKIASVMVGREREIDLLEEYIKNLVTGKGTVINIVGKAGIGKSRLMAEIKAQSSFKGMVLLQGSASSIGKNLSYHPIISIFKSWAKIIEDDSPVVSAGKLQKEIQRVAPDKVDEIYPFIATMMGLPLSGKHKDRIVGIEGEALEKLTLKNLRDLIITLVKVTPLIIVIEDMHWADSSSITFLESLYKLSVNHRVMVINVLRPGYKETGDYVLKHLVDNLPGNHITINITPLAVTESNELIGNLLQQTQLPDEINEVIVKKTEGNPFFIEEVIRSFIDEGIIEIKDNRFHVTDKVHTAKIPETINEVIISRVDKLDEKTKELLKTASVIGRNFYYKVLEEAADTIGELDSRIEYLKDVQLIGESRKKDEIEFLFKHALAQQATYESIIQNTKKELHLKIARSIEKVFTENLHEHYGSLAYHYGKAENTEKTEEYLIKAGNHALGSGASSEASSFFKDALNIYSKRQDIKTDDDKIADLYYKVGLALHQGGNNIEAIDYFDKYLVMNGFYFPKNKLIKILGSIYYFFYFIVSIYFNKYFYKKPYSDASFKMILIFSQRGEAMTTINPARVFIEIFYISRIICKYDFTKTDITAGMFCEISTFLFWTGISMRIANKIQELARKSISKEQPRSLLKYRFIRSMYEYLTGTWEKDKDIEYIYNTGMRIGAFWETTIYILYCGLQEIENGSWKATKIYMDRLLDISEYFDNSHAKAQYYRLAGRAYNKFRRLDDTLKSTDDGKLYTSSTGHTAMLLTIYCNHSIACSLKNNVAEAELNLREAGELLAERKRIIIYYTAFLLAKTHYEIALLNKSQRDKVAAKNVLRTSKLLIKKSKKAVSNLAEAYRLRANIYWKLNKESKALYNFSKAIETSEKHNGRLELSRAYFETGKFLSDPNTKQNQLNGLSGKEYLEKARVMFEEMDLQWDLEEHGKFIKKDWKTKS